MHPLCRGCGFTSGWAFRREGEVLASTGPPGLDLCFGRVLRRAVPVELRRLGCTHVLGVSVVVRVVSSAYRRLRLTPVLCEQ